MSMLDYENIVSEKRKENLFQLQLTLIKAETFEEIEDESLKQKITSHWEVYGLDLEDFFQELRTNEYLQSFFAKNPLKQGLHEQIAIKYLSEELPTFKQVRKLSQKNNCGLFLNSTGLSKSRSISKAIDFYLESDNNIYVFTHKYTKQSGGAQNNQYEDVLNFLRYAPNSPFKDQLTNKTVHIGAILDGDFYTDKIEETQNKFPTYLIGNINQVLDKIKEIEAI